MKNNDFDYMKNQFDNRGVNAPDSLNEAAVMELLSEQQPVQALPPKQNKKKLAAGVSAAAVLAVVTPGAVTLTSLHLNPFQNGEKVLFGETAALRTFSSRAQVQSALSDLLKIEENTRQYIYEIEEDALTSGDIGFNSGPIHDSTHNATYEQETGVAEADNVKTDGKYIYYLDNSWRQSIQVFSAEGENAEKVCEIQVGEGDNYIASEDFFLYENKLITLTDCYVDDRADNEDSGSYRQYQEITKVQVFDISDVENVRLIDSFSQSGSYISSRMIGGMLYVVSNDHIYASDDLPFVYENGGATADSAARRELPIDQIYSVDTPTVNSFLVVSSINTDKSVQATKTKAILGSADIIYCNQENLYVTAYEYSAKSYAEMLNNTVNFTRSLVNWDKSPEETQIIKISLEKDIEFVASNKVAGTVDNQYALDEYEGNLRVATTSYDENGKPTNNLFVLDRDLKQIGQVTGFAEDETIRAVRYINDTAYVITYMETDPLFVIDLSNPTLPQIKGEVKISGFSTLLVPVDDNTLLGIGYHSEFADELPYDINQNGGLKIVTFDVTDKSHPQVLDSKVFAHYFSQVQYNPKALLVNFERGDFAIPMNYCSYGEWKDGVYEYNVTPVTKNGVLNFRIDNGKINIIDDYTSDKISGEYASVERCVYVGDYIYLLGSTDYNNTVIDCVKYK